MKPVIGLTSSYDYNKGYSYLKSGYYSAISNAGGVPVILPVTDDVEYPEDIVENIHGLLLTGGCDVDPALYGELPCRHLGMVSPERDRMEIRLVKLCVEKDIPILAICRGIQVLNVALGGTLYQDIPSQIDGAIMHEQGEIPTYYGIHSVRIDENSLLYKVIGNKNLIVNSFHHQAVKLVAPCLKAVAWSEDGVIEAVEGIGFKFVLGVQWHPERMWSKSPENFKIFKDFIGHI